MSDIKVDEFYKSTDEKDIVQIVGITKDNMIDFKLIEDPHKFWDVPGADRKDIMDHLDDLGNEVYVKRYYREGFKKYYKHLKGYGTPLWKAINSKE